MVTVVTAVVMTRRAEVLRQGRPLLNIFGKQYHSDNMSAAATVMAALSAAARQHLADQPVSAVVAVVLAQGTHIAGLQLVGPAVAMLLTDMLLVARRQLAERAGALLMEAVLAVAVVLAAVLSIAALVAAVLAVAVLAAMVLVAML